MTRLKLFGFFGVIAFATTALASQPTNGLKSPAAFQQAQDACKTEITAAITHGVTDALTQSGLEVLGASNETVVPNDEMYETVSEDILVKKHNGEQARLLVSFTIQDASSDSSTPYTDNSGQYDNLGNPVPNWKPQTGMLHEQVLDVSMDLDQLSLGNADTNVDLTKTYWSQVVDAVNTVEGYSTDAPELTIPCTKNQKVSVRIPNGQ